MTLRLGTRGSALAMVQARWVASLLGGPEGVEIIEVVTPGDRGVLVGDKTRWVSSLEAALVAEEIDVAVHSAKDVPGELAPGTVIAAVPEREPVADVLIGSLGPVIGTASLRRAAQLRAVDPSLSVQELRGNVDTRLRKLDAGEVDGLVLARAGLARLGRLERVARELDLVPAPGQGALALQTSVAGAAALAGASDPAAFACVAAERELARRLGASCHTPMGASAVWVRAAGGSDPGELSLTGWVGLVDGSEWIRDSVSGPPDGVAARLAERMLAAGAADLLARAELDAEVLG